MAKYFVTIVILTALGSLLLRIILENAPVTATWLSDVNPYKGQ